MILGDMPEGEKQHDVLLILIKSTLASQICFLWYFLLMFELQEFAIRYKISFPFVPFNIVKQ